MQRAVKLGDEEVSLAHYYLGGIYWGWREYQRAADELETYLRLTSQATHKQPMMSRFATPSRNSGANTERHILPASPWLFDEADRERVTIGHAFIGLDRSNDHKDKI